MDSHGRTIPLDSWFPPSHWTPIYELLSTPKDWWFEQCPVFRFHLPDAGNAICSPTFDNLQVFFGGNRASPEITDDVILEISCQLLIGPKCEFGRWLAASASKHGNLPMIQKQIFLIRFSVAFDNQSFLLSLLLAQEFDAEVRRSSITVRSHYRGRCVTGVL